MSQSLCHAQLTLCLATQPYFLVQELCFATSRRISRAYLVHIFVFALLLFLLIVSFLSSSLRELVFLIFHHSKLQRLLNPYRSFCEQPQFQSLASFLTLPFLPLFELAILLPSITFLLMLNLTFFTSPVVRKQSLVLLKNLAHPSFSQSTPWLFLCQIVSKTVLSLQLLCCSPYQ